MGDQDFDFSPPPPRRERKEFEPPPWEKDKFAELAKRVTDVTPPVVDSENGSHQAPAFVEPVVITKQAAPEPDTRSEPKPEVLLAEGRVTAMLFELRAEDPPADRGFNKIRLIAGVVLLALGILLVIWAAVMIVVALQRGAQGRTGLMVGLTVLMFGAAFAGTGAWFVFKSLRQQGVL